MLGNYKIIALCTCRIQDKESHNFIAMLNEKLVKVGCRLFIYNTCWVTPKGQENTDPQLSIYELIDNKFIDAVVIQADRFYNYDVCQKIVDKSLKVGLPVISLGTKIDGCVNIHYDHQKGFKEIIKHLIDVHNIKDFHMIAGLRNNIYSNERIEVFKEVLAEYNLPFSEDMLSFGDYWPLPAKEIAQKLIDEKRVPKAFICANDNMAIAVTEVLKLNGINVPNDVAVTGFDCIDAIYSTEPTITSAFISPTISAQVIYESIYDVIYNNKKEGTISLSSKMVINESCGCKSLEKINLTPYLNEQNSLFCQYQDDSIALAAVCSKIQLCEDFEEAAIIMKESGLMNSMCCFLKPEFIDDSIDPASLLFNNFTYNLFMLYESDSNDISSFKSQQISLETLRPKLLKYLEEGRSLIFSALHHAGVPIGYVCFYFEEHMVKNYYSVPQIVNNLNNGLGELQNKKHREYLTSQIEALSQIDVLTGLYNRRGFTLEYRRKYENVIGIPLTVIMCDLDDLKLINDTYGHEEGDIAIQKVARALQKVCPINSIITRFGGDEMLAVFEDSIDDKKIYNDFQEKLNQSNEEANKDFSISASVGIYHTTTSTNLDLNELIKNSDKLMYADKIKRKLKRRG